METVASAIIPPMPISLAPLILMLLAGLLVLVTLTVVMMARMLLRPPRMTDGRATYILQRISPADLGLEFEQTRFAVRDEATGQLLQLAGWWIPHRQARGRCVILVHGYADAKVGAIAWAPLFHELGWNILAIDLRAHGYSEGRICTAGYFERNDLVQVVQQVRAERPDDTACLALFGASMGAAVCAGAAVLLQGLGEDVAGAILDCPFADLQKATVLQYGAMGLPRGELARAAVRLADWMSGGDFAAVRPVEWIGQLECPTMLIQAGMDPVVPPEDARLLAVATEWHAGNSIWRVEDAGHLMAIVANPAEYTKHVGQFLAQLLHHFPVREAN